MAKFLLVQVLTMLPVDHYTILSVLTLDNVAIYSILSIHMNRTFLYLFSYHLFHLCNSTTTYTADQDSNDLRSWDYPLFLLFHFILFLYTFTLTLSKVFIDYIQNKHGCALHITIFYKYIFLR